MTEHLQPATQAVHVGRPPRVPGGALNPSITPSSTFHAADSGDAQAPVYARAAHPDWVSVESIVSALETTGTDTRAYGVAFGSGVAAAAAVLDLCPPGGTVALSVGSYHGTTHLAQQLAANGRFTLTIASPEQLGHLAANLTWIETPTNPLLDVVDVRTIADAAHAYDSIVVVDNTLATPLVQQPITWGADVVVHSASKALAGHSDLLLGVAVTTSPNHADQLRAYRTTHGAVAGPWDTWLAVRGMRTAHLRVERASANAANLAARLGRHSAVREVRYPGAGFVIAIDVGEAVTAEAVCAATTIWTNATSFGGVESLLERRRRHSGESNTVSEGLIRLSVGIEDVDDLWLDLSRALKAAS